MAKKDDAPVEEPKSEPTPDYAKQIADLKSSFEKTISEQGQQLKDMESFVTGASTVINTIANDPDLTARFKETLARGQGVQGQQPQERGGQASNYSENRQPSNEVVEQVTELRSERRDEIVRQFEKDYGIEQLPSEEQKEVRQKLANYLGDFGWEVPKIPVTALRNHLDKAWVGTVGVERLKEEGKLDGWAQARSNAQGMVGALPGGAPANSDGTPKLTDDQIKWAQKLRVDVSGAEKTYNERDKEAEREKPQGQ